MSEKKTVVYLGVDGVYRRIRVERCEKSGDYVVYRQTLWKGKKHVAPKEIYRSKHPTSLVWDGDESHAPRIQSRITIMEPELREFLSVLTGEKWGTNTETHNVRVAYHGDDISEAVLKSGIARYQGMRQWLSTRQGDVLILLDKNPISYYDLKIRVIKQMEVLLKQYIEWKEKRGGR